MTAPATFGWTQFDAAPLGHRARVACLVKIAARIHRHPGGTLPTKLHAPKDYKAMDRLMNRPEVTHARVLAAPCARTRQRLCDTPGVSLILHDTTELDYSGLKSIADLGSLGCDRNRGLHCHNSLAYDPRRREVIGLVNQVLHRRRCVSKRVRRGEPRRHEGVRRKRERVDRESRLWLTGARAVGPAPDGCRWVHVADRGADTFEFLALLVQQLRQSFVIRSSSNRVIRCGHDADADADAPTRRLTPYARSLPRAGRRDIAVAARPGQPPRTATVSIGFAAVRVMPPHVRRGDYEKTPLPVGVICVREDHPPPGVTPVEWILLTDITPADTAAAWEQADWYACRWVLEEYHKAQKTGCGIEQLQFTSSQALEPMIALLSVVAVTLLNLREMSRQPDASERPATTVVDAEAVRVLSVWRHGRPRPDWSVHDFFLALARLGGHQNRKGDHHPGWLVLWRGWMALQHMLAGALTAPERNRG